MILSAEDKRNLIKELEVELNAKLDGGRKNLIVPTCVYCGHTGGKLGIYVGPERPGKTFLVAHCFSCGHTAGGERFLKDIGRSDLIPSLTVSFAPLELPKEFQIGNDEEIDDELVEVEMPEGWKRCFRNIYLKERGFEADDYDYFPVGTTRGLNFKYDNYVVFPIRDNGVNVGYISRHTWSKKEIDKYNTKAKLAGKYQIRRYNNSTENEFSKLLYNYDAVIEDETDTVILTEGVFDTIALTRKLNLYDNSRIVPVATFGKKISDTQIFKLQSKGVTDIVIGYDSDASSSINDVAAKLDEYFDNVLIAQIDSETGKDWDEMDYWEIYDTFANNLKTPIEFKLNNANG